MISRAALRAWYEPRRDAYPWRSVRDPYRVLVSEVMLQQTQAARVVPAYRRFIRRFPTVRILARASRADVVRAWAGLGYNRRAVALSEAARSIVRDHGGRVPRDVEALERLPGVGRYTAAAVASIAYGEPVPALDTNVQRVVARAVLGRDDVSSAAIRAAAARAIDRSDPAAWNQAVMDLGREVCRPIPRCTECPLRRACAFRRSGARPSRGKRRQGRFEGSTRQLRGSIVRALRQDAGRVADLARTSGAPAERVGEVLRGLAADGLVTADAAAVRGDPAGRVRLRR